MKTRTVLALAFLVAASAACASDPRVLDQHPFEEASATPPSKMLIVVDSKALADPRVHDEIQAYTTGMAAAVQDALAPIPAQFLDITGTATSRPAGGKLLELRPSHLIRLVPAGSGSVNGLPVSYTWTLELADVSITRFPAAYGRPSGTSVKTIPTYEIRAEGDACFSTVRHAQECGAAMGKVLGETLRAAPGLHLQPNS